MRKLLIALIALAAGGAAVASAQVGGFVKLTGWLVITGEETSDPPPGQKIDRVGLDVSGEAAKQIYDAMSAKAQKDECEDGMRTKRAGALKCYRTNDGDYGCTLAILLASGQTRPFGDC